MSAFHIRRTLVGLAMAAGLAAGPALAAESGDGPDSLDKDDQAVVDRVERYLNELDTMTSRFIQVASTGEIAEGEINLDRPGHVRFDYDPPHPVVMVANGITLLYYDREVKQATFLPLWETPLWFLVRENVDLGGRLAVLEVEEERGMVRLTVQDSERPGAGRVKLVFSNKPLELEKWEILDPQGITTEVSLKNTRFGQDIDEDVFDYSDLDIDKGFTSGRDR